MNIHRDILSLTLLLQSVSDLQRLMQIVGSYDIKILFSYPGPHVDTKPIPVN